MNFPLYRFCATPSVADITRMGVPRDLAKEIAARKLDWKDIISQALQYSTDAQDESTLAAMLVEYEVHRHRVPTLFIDDQNIVDLIFNAKFTIDYDELAMTCIPHAVGVSFASSIKLGKLKAEPFLFGKLNIAEILQTALGIKGTYAEVPSRLISVKRWALGHLVSIIGNQTDLERYLDLKQPMFDEIKSGMTSQEDIEIRTYGRFALGLLVYLQAFPDSLKFGFPDSMKERDVRISGVVGKILLAPKGKKLPAGAHWRDGHFRHLRDKRFKRNPDGSVRIVYIHPCVVNSEMEPYHVSPKI